MGTRIANGRRYAAGLGLLAAGVVAGGVLTGTLSASAATTTPTPSSGYSADVSPGGAARGVADGRRADCPEDAATGGGGTGGGTTAPEGAEPAESSAV
ncbi:hypothetical protein [Motilibacter aurantiacus]|uniref:hypothetical protein n=1 Tax=Motilibacter aurantiacus TaxID=2714955 RepID=UPI00140C48CF|nr:hypothetical protein [Motilibacter aurantiacus]NHC46154.1 hypothetical protein [Motilibacter aurantiacus]